MSVLPHIITFHSPCFIYADWSYRASCLPMYTVVKMLHIIVSGMSFRPLLPVAIRLIACVRLAKIPLNYLQTRHRTCLSHRLFVGGFIAELLLPLERKQETQSRGEGSLGGRKEPRGDNPTWRYEAGLLLYVVIELEVAQGSGYRVE